MDVRLPDGTVISNVPDNMSKADLTAKLSSNGYDVSKLAMDAAKPAQPPEQFGERMNREIANIPRQIGLTARHGMEGLGEVLDFASTPFRAGLNAILPKKQSMSGLVTGQGPQDAIQPGAGRYLADMIGLPTPRTPVERGVGDATRTAAGALLPFSLASKLSSTATGTTQAVSKLMAANPLQQVASAGAAGGAGGYVRETGGNDTSQLLASLAAGVAAPMAANKAGQLWQKAGNLVSPRTMNPQQVDISIERALTPSGLKLGDLPANVRNSIRTDVQAALKTNGTLSPDAVRRLADYRLTGTTPTSASLTLDPAMVTQQKNLSKLGANSKDKAAQQLAHIEDSNNRQLISNLNDLGGGTADDAYVGGQKIIGALSARNEAAKSAIGARYEAARASNGRAAGLDPYAFTQNANNLLDDALLGGKLPGDVRNLLNKAAEGKMPLTVDVAEQLKTRIGDLQRASNDMAERKALGMVRQALDDTPLLDGQGAEAITAFGKARRLNRAWMGIVEKTPALQAARDGVEPDKFVQQFIVGNGAKTNVADLAALKNSVRSNPEAMRVIRGQIVAHLKTKAVNGKADAAADETAKLSQSSYNKALDAIGDRKLAMFFSKSEIDMLRANGRVASYEQFQPQGSAVNNSNTASAGMSTLIDRIADSSLLSKIPFGSQITGPAQNISVGIKSRQSLNVPSSLIGPGSMMAPRQPTGLLMSPAVAIRPEDERKGLLRP